MSTRSSAALFWLKHVLMLRHVQVPSTANVQEFGATHRVPRRISARGCKVTSINSSLKHVLICASEDAVPLCTANASPSKNLRTRARFGDTSDVHNAPLTTVFGGVGFANEFLLSLYSRRTLSLQPLPLAQRFFRI